MLRFSGHYAHSRCTKAILKSNARLWPPDRVCANLSVEAQGKTLGTPVMNAETISQLTSFAAHGAGRNLQTSSETLIS